RQQGHLRARLQRLRVRLAVGRRRAHAPRLAVRGAPRRRRRRLCDRRDGMRRRIGLISSRSTSHQSLILRRGSMQRAVVLGVLVAAGATVMATAACHASWLSVVPAAHIQKVKDNLYVIGGSDPSDRDAFIGGNTGVLVTDAGVVVVDTKLAGWGQLILDEI